MNKRRKHRLVIGIFALSATTVVSVLSGIKKGDILSLAFDSEWVHYSAIEPTKTTKGIKEYYVSCATNTHVFNAPASFKEGVWTDSKKKQIYEIENDDRTILSFNDLDKTLSSVSGENVFDFVDISNTKKYIDENYSSDAKNSYISESNLVYELDDLYQLSFENQFDMENATYYNGNSKLTISKQNDQIYGSYINVNITNDIVTNENSRFDITNFNSYFSSNSKEIGFAIYSSEVCEVNLGLKYNDATSQYMNFKLNEGWNQFSYTKGSTNYGYFTNLAEASKTIESLMILMVKEHKAGNSLRFASFIANKANSGGEMLKAKISNLPSHANVSPYDISKINKLLAEYNSLNETEKNKVTNYSTLVGLKNYWDSLYILLYDMGSDYASINTNAGVTQSTYFNRDYGHVLQVKINSGGTFIDLKNVNNMYTTAKISKMTFMLSPNRDCFMSWSSISNYGRAEWDGTQKLTDMPMYKDTWNEFSIEGTRNGTDVIELFMNYFSNNTTIRNDFVPTNNRWGSYYVAEVGFSYQMSSIIGLRKVEEKVTKLIGDIDSICTGVPKIEKAGDLTTLENTFNTLSSNEKNLITNIDKLYNYKDLFNQSFPYLYSPSVKLHSFYQKTFITDDDFVYEVESKYGPAYKFSFIKENYGTNISFDCGFGNELENNGFYLFTKNFSNQLKLVMNEPTYGVEIAVVYPTSVGDGWYKYSFTKENYDAIQAIGNYRVSYCFGGHNVTNVDIYMSGTFYVPVTSVDDRNSVQANINLVNDMSIDEFIWPKISEVQKEIVSLNAIDQASLTGVNLLNSKYAEYKQKYANVYSMGVYRVGKWWTGTVNDIVKSYDVNFGDIYTVTSDTENGPYLTIGTWALNGTTGSHRGYGKELSPIPSGKYKKVTFAIYVPYDPQGSGVTLKCWNDNDVNFDLLSQNLVQGWNKIVFTGDSLDKLCGKSGDFKGISIVLPARTEQSYNYKISSFVGEKDNTYTGLEEHYATDSLHKGSYNIESTSYQLMAGGTTNYKFICPDTTLTSAALTFINKTLNNKIGGIIGNSRIGTPSENSRYIFVGDISAMNEMGIVIPSEDVLGETGYVIKTIGSSAYMFAYGKEGYELAAAKFLEALIGFDWMSNDTTIYEKNGAIFSTSITVYLPDFDVVERPDYDMREHSNAPLTHTYGSYLENDKMYNHSCCNVYHFLDKTTFDDCYYYKYYDETLHYDASVLCFNAMGNSTRRNEMIKTVGDKMIENDQLNLGYAFAALFQGDTKKTCDCSACQKDLADYGYASATVVRFMNDLDNYIKANYSQRSIKLTFLAYLSTFKAPINGLKCNDDVVPFIAPSNARWNHSFYEEENSTAKGEVGAESGKTYAYDNDFASEIENWDALCDKYVMWAYQAQNGNFLYVYNTFESMYDQYRFFYNNGCDAMFNEGVTSTVTSGFVSLKDYLDSKALFDVNGSYDEVYEKFFKYYYGCAGEIMRIIFDEAINNVNFLADTYGRANNYNPESHPSKSGLSYYYDGVMDINAYANYSKFWNNTGDCYNGNNGKCNGKNIANLPYWVSLANQAVDLTSSGDSTIFKHVQRDVIFPYYCDYEINSTSTYVGRICRYCYDNGVYWANETNTRTDNYQGLTGTNTICYKLTGKTFQEMYES